MNEERKSIFITGAASGMGRATARLFASKNWFVGCYDVNAQGLDAMWRLMPAEAVAEVVWAAYHDTRLHWYVPDDLEAREMDVVENVEKVRDDSIKNTFGTGTS